MHADHAIAYIRVSTDEQELGPEAQRSTIETYARAKGITIVGWAEELGVSGAAPLDEREGLWAAVESTIDSRAGLLLIGRRDRLARDVFTSMLIERHLEARGARVESADGSANGSGPEAKLLRTMLDAIAEYERAIIRARTKAALAAKARRGERTGGVPYGKRLAVDGRTLETDPAEAAVIARIHQLRSSGLTFQAITDRLNELAIPARGKRWHITTIQRVLRSHP